MRIYLSQLVPSLGCVLAIAVFASDVRGDEASRATGQTPAVGSAIRRLESKHLTLYTDLPLATKSTRCRVTSIRHSTHGARTSASMQNGTLIGTCAAT